MSRACRIFRLRGSATIADLSSKLHNAGSEYDQIVPGTSQSVKLRVTAEKLLFYDEEEMATGTFVYDEPVVIRRRDGSVSVEVQSLSTNFGLVGKTSHLIVFSNQYNAEYVRARTTPILAQQATRATSVKIEPDRMNDFLQRHLNIQRSCSWAGLRLPRLSKAQLRGFDINHTPDYARYEQHGVKNSVMFTLRTPGWTITVNAQGAFTVWNNVEEVTVLRFIRDEILQLCSSTSQQSLGEAFKLA